MVKISPADTFSQATILPTAPSAATQEIVHGELKVAPGLLIAMPQLNDPNFHRSVVLMVEHQDEGSFGLILNRPSESRVLDLLEPLDIVWRGNSCDVAWWAARSSLRPVGSFTSRFRALSATRRARSLPEFIFRPRRTHFGSCRRNHLHGFDSYWVMQAGAPNSSRVS